MEASLRFEPDRKSLSSRSLLATDNPELVPETRESVTIPNGQRGRRSRWRVLRIETFIDKGGD
jgi:hypothetical protein